MPATAGIKVQGLREFNRAIRLTEKATATEVRKALRDAGGPVRDHAESLAQSRIPTSTVKWSRMRLGSTVRSVYVAPKARRSGGGARPNYGGLLMQKAMIPAVQEKQEQVLREFEEALDRVADVFHKS